MSCLCPVCFIFYIVIAWCNRRQQLVSKKTRLLHAERILCKETRSYRADDLSGDSLLEIDMAFFRSIELLLKFEEVYVQVTIELPARFREGDDTIHMRAEDTYNKNYRREVRHEVGHDVQDPMVAEDIFNHTEEMTKEIARLVMDRLSY